MRRKLELIAEAVLPVFGFTNLFAWKQQITILLHPSNKNRLTIPLQMKGLGEKGLVIEKKAKGQEVMNTFFEAFRQEE